MDRFESMRVLIKVAELGSFSAAARAMNLSPSMVTKHVAAQEERLGTPLFQRTTRKVSLTDIGRTYLELAGRLVSGVEDAEALTSASHLAVRGLLRVSCPVSFGSRHIAPLMAAFHNTYPSLVVELGLNDRVVDLAEEGWDLAIRVGRLPDSNLIARKLASSRMMLCASPSYLQNYGTPKTIDDLKFHACLGYTLSKSVGFESWAFGRDGKSTVRIKGPLRTNNGDALVAAAISGLGLTYQPSFILMAGVNSGELISLELDQPMLDLGSIYSIYLHNGNVPAKVRAFIDFLASQFRDGQSWSE